MQHPAFMGSGRSQLSHLILRGPPARQWDELQPRAWTPAIFDLSHADILADRSEVSILNVVVMIEYSTLGGAQQMLTYR
jgi:hypothetical protein